MIADYGDKDRIIVQQHMKICTLADESEKLRQERDQLLSVLRELRTSPTPTNLAMLSGIPQCDIELDHSNSGLPQHSKSSTKRSVSQRPRSRTKSSNLSNQFIVDESSYPAHIRESSRHHILETDINCLPDKTAGNRSELPYRPSLSRQRSFKRSRNCEDFDDSNQTRRSSETTKPLNYELSVDVHNKQIEMLERKYGGGAIKTQQAAEIIQYNFRQYTLSKNFERLRNTQDELRAQRIMSDISSEKDSVWSDVTVSSYPSPSGHDDHYKAIALAQDCDIDNALPPSHRSGYITPNSNSIECLVIPAAAKTQYQSNRQSSRSREGSQEKLHVVKSAHKDDNDNVQQVPSPISLLAAYDSHTDSINELTCSCQSSDSGDTMSLGSNGDSMSYARNNSVSESRLLNVRVQFNKCSDKERKRQYRIGLNLFNKKPEQGIKYLMEQRFLENSSKAVSKFLLQRKGLSKQMIGDYLGNLQNSFNQDVLVCVVQELDLAGTEIDQALRQLINHFRLPGEAQKIERIIERFAQRYCLCNPTFVTRFNSVDTIFLISFAIIMLNTDLHNPNIKPARKMKLDGFIKNLKGIDRGNDVPSDMLTRIYERIQNQELRTGADHTTQVRKVEETMVGKVPQLVVPHRRLVCYCRLYEVQDPQRKEKIGLHQREVFLFNDILVITKIFTKKKNSITYTFRQSVPLNDILIQGFENENYYYGIKLVSRIDRKPLMYFNARNQHDREKFVEDLRESIAEMQEMDAMRIANELKKQHISDEHGTSRSVRSASRPDIGLVKPANYSASRLSAPVYPQPQCAADHQARSTSLTDLDQDSRKRLSNGSVDSGMISTSTSSMASREDSPNFNHKHTKTAMVAPQQLHLHSPPSAGIGNMHKKARASSSHRNMSRLPPTTML